ncbi:alpha-tectorin-like [Salmo trutta]|uniref:alpha-tectorin-like n=1 Tax=Salmo trutta TaxID=8032 RepID=UPI001131A0D5|nr:alpha-tectorin-like [Salmo trutta]
MVQNDHAQNHFPSIKALQLTVYKDHTVIQRGYSWVNGQRRLLPVTLRSGSVKVHQSSLFSVVDTSFGLHVKYDWFYYILVSLPKSCSDMCGNNHGNKDDDLRIPEGATAVDEAAFTWSWRRVLD